MWTEHSTQEPLQRERACNGHHCLQTHEQRHLWEVPPERDEAESPQVCEQSVGGYQGAVTPWLCEECVPQWELLSLADVMHEEVFV